MADIGDKSAHEPVEIVQVSWTTHSSLLRQLRRQVFVKEQGVSEEDEWDDLDQDAVHFLALTPAGTAVATARLLRKGKLTRMAVARDFRNLGLGARVLEQVLQSASQLGIQTLRLDAQLSAQGFYERQGFLPEGDVFLDAGIEHVAMYRHLASPEEDVRSGAVFRFGQPSEALRLMRSYTRGARSTLDILSYRLVPSVFCDEELLEGISNIARASPRSKIRILVRDTRPLHGAGHALVNLALRLPSRITLRKMTDDIPVSDVGFYCVDRAHLVYFASEANFSGFARYQARAESRQRLAEFEHWWNYASEDDPNLRSLAL